MAWVEIDLEDDKAKYVRKKLRLLADEDVDERIVNTLRTKSVDIVTVTELGYGGRDDVDIYQLAQKHKRVLLTFNGRDFQDSGRFPLQTCQGFLWLDFPRDEAGLGEAVFDILQLRWIGNWKAKVRLRRGWQFEVWSLDQTGSIQKKRFRFIGNRIEEWRD